MVGEQVVVEGVGVIPVQAPALVEGELGEVAVVGVHVDERDGEGAEVVGDVRWRRWICRCRSLRRFR